MAQILRNRVFNDFIKSSIVKKSVNNFAPLVQTRCLSASPEAKVSPQQGQDDASQSFGMNLFRGKIRADQVFPFPSVMNEDEESTLRMLVGPSEKFFTEINDGLKNDELEAIPDDVLNEMKELGAFGMQVPVELGGLGLTNTQYARMTEICGASDLGVGIALGAHQSIGFKGITLFGSPAQKQKYLPDLASGKKIAAFCLTEPSAGSDASSIRSRAVLSDDGKHYILNGSKIWISNGGTAEVFTVFAQTPVTNKTTGKTKDKVTAFIVERSFGGVTNGPPEKKMGIKASNTAEVYFEDVKIPVENVLDGVGKGFKVAMKILNNGRFGMGAALTGTMKFCLKKATEHAAQRKQFGREISGFGVIQEKLTRMAMSLYVSEAMAYMVAANMDQGFQEFQIEAAISKIFASESAWFCADEALQILGGMGYMRETGIEKVMRDLRIFRIFEGTNDILRLFIALTGIQYSGIHLKKLQKALQNPASNVGLLFDAGARRARRMVGLSGSSNSLIPYVHVSLTESAQQVGKAIEDFGAAVEALLIKHGEGIIEQQMVLSRLANAAIDTYAMVSSLSRASKALEEESETAEHEAELVSLFCNEASERIGRNLEATSSGSDRKNYNLVSSIADSIIKTGGHKAKHPLGF